MYYELIEQIACEMSGQSLQPPSPFEDLDELKKKSVQELGAPIPLGYFKFLAVTNGLLWNGLTIYASKPSPVIGIPNLFLPGFIEANSEYRLIREGDPMDDYLIFGEDSIAFFTYKISKKAYQVITVVGMTTLESYRTFEELVVDALQGHV